MTPTPPPPMTNRWLMSHPPRPPIMRAGSPLMDVYPSVGPPKPPCSTRPESSVAGSGSPEAATVGGGGIGAGSWACPGAGLEASWPAPIICAQASSARLTEGAAPNARSPRTIVVRFMMISLQVVQSRFMVSSRSRRALRSSWDELIQGPYQGGAMSVSSFHQPGGMRINSTHGAIGARSERARCAAPLRDAAHLLRA